MTRKYAWVRRQFTEHLLGLSLGASAAVAIAVVAVAIFDSGWLTGSGLSNESGSTTIRNLGFVIAGLIALPLAVWRAQVADQQATAANRQAETAQLTLLNEHYQRGVERLHSDELPECLAGIDALRRLAEDHPREYHIQVMALLCRFVRRPGKAAESFDYSWVGDDSDSSERQRVYELREDVQAAMDAICTCHARRLRREGKGGAQLDLSGAHLQGLQLRHTSLFRADLRAADLTDAQLTDVDLSRARLARAIFRSVRLWGVDLASSRGAPTSLALVDLTDARLIDLQMGGVNLRGANLTGTRFGHRRGPDTTARAVGGLTQEQLDRAIADPDNPPWLDGMMDPETGEQLVPPSNGARWERYQRSKRKS